MNLSLFEFGDTPPYQKIFDYQGGDQPIYIGWATPGVAQSYAGWKIIQLTYSTITVSGSSISVLTQIQYANGDPNFHAQWSNRTSYVYS